MFGFSKTFVATLFIAFIFGYEWGWKSALGIICFYAVIRSVWKLLT